MPPMNAARISDLPATFTSSHTAMHCTSKALLTGAFGPALRRSNTLPPAFLIPSLNSTSQAQPFSSTAPQARKNTGKPGNPARSTSALRRTGLTKRQPLFTALAIAKQQKEDEEKSGIKSTSLRGYRKGDSKRILIDPSRLPQPVRDPEQRSAVEVDPDHGLWDFFNESRSVLMTPTELNSHGRAWYVQELRRKGWEDLHRLWWVCIKEMNRLRTFTAERERIGKMYGDYEMIGRKDVIKRTMSNIRFVLTERWYTWENARVAAMEDPSINLYADPRKGEAAYNPSLDPQLGRESLELLEQPKEDESQAAMSIPPPDMARSGTEARV